MSRLFGLEYLKQDLIPELEKDIRDTFAEWAAKPSIDVPDSTPDVSAIMANNLLHFPIKFDN